VEFFFLKKKKKRKERKGYEFGGPINLFWLADNVNGFKKLKGNGSRKHVLDPK
jgi:hypothetical protein